MLSDAALVLVLAVVVDPVFAEADDADTSSIPTRHADEVQAVGTTGIPRFASPDTVITSMPLTKRSLCGSADTVSPSTSIGEPPGETVLLFRTTWVGLTTKIWEEIVMVSWGGGSIWAVIRLACSQSSRNKGKKQE